MLHKRWTEPSKWVFLKRRRRKTVSQEAYNVPLYGTGPLGSVLKHDLFRFALKSVSFSRCPTLCVKNICNCICKYQFKYLPFFTFPLFCQPKYICIYIYPFLSNQLYLYLYFFQCEYICIHHFSTTQIYFIAFCQSILKEWLKNTSIYPHFVDKHSPPPYPQWQIL